MRLLLLFAAPPPDDLIVVAFLMLARYHHHRFLLESQAVGGIGGGIEDTWGSSASTWNGSPLANYVEIVSDNPYDTASYFTALIQFR